MKVQTLFLIFPFLMILSPSMGEPWQTIIDGAANSSDEAKAVVIDTSGDVIAAGQTENTGTGSDFTVVKLRGSDGVEIWRQEIDGTGGDSFGFDSDTAHAVAVNTEGDVVAVGTIENASTGLDFLVMKLRGSDGVELWRHVIDGTTSDEAYAVAVDPGGDIVAAGTTDNRRAGNFTVVKLRGSDGVEMWRQEIDGSFDTAARAVGVDETGDVVVAGSIESRLNVVKLRGSDGGGWRYVDSANSTEFQAVRVDAASDVVAGGGRVVVKLRGSDGAGLWRRADDHAVLGPVSALGVDQAGDAIAAMDLGGRLLVVKLRGSNGGELWRWDTGLFDFGHLGALGVDQANDVVVAGSTTGRPLLYSRPYGFLVMKLRGSDGVELWRHVIDGTTSDEAYAVAVDPGGDIVAAGALENTGTPPTEEDFTVVKLRGSDGSGF
jgi:hypothetical protein